MYLRVSAWHISWCLGILFRVGVWDRRVALPHAPSPVRDGVIGRSAPCAILRSRKVIASAVEERPEHAKGAKRKHVYIREYDTSRQ